MLPRLIIYVLLNTNVLLQLNYFKHLFPAVSPTVFSLPGMGFPLPFNIPINTTVQDLSLFNVQPFLKRKESVCSEYLSCELCSILGAFLGIHLNLTTALESWCE